MAYILVGLLATAILCSYIGGFMFALFLADEWWLNRFDYNSALFFITAVGLTGVFSTFITYGWHLLGVF